MLLWRVETLRKRSGLRFRILPQLSVLFLLSYAVLYFVVLEVAAVDPGTLATGAGIAPGDLLVELGGVRLDGSLELSTVAALGFEGKPADLFVWRDGKLLKLRIHLERAR